MTPLVENKCPNCGASIEAPARGADYRCPYCKHQSRAVADVGVIAAQIELGNHEVKRGSAEEELVVRLCSNYIASLKASDPKGERKTADEDLMGSIEAKVGIPDARRRDFRREILNFVAALSIEGQTFQYFTNDRVRDALERQLFEDRTAAASEELERRWIRSYRRADEPDDTVLALVRKIFAP